MDWRLAITGDNERLYREKFLRLVAQMDKGGTLVDVGGGTGDFTEQVADIREPRKVIIVDHDAKDKKKLEKLGYEFILSDLNDGIRLKAKSADLVVCNQVIEHVADTDKLTVEIQRILKPKGKAIICTPNLAAWHNILALAMGYQPFSTHVSNQTYIGNPWHPLKGTEIGVEQAHLRVFTMRSLRELCELHGLKIVTQVGAGYYPLPVGVAQWAAKFDQRHSAYLLVVAERK